MSKPLVSVVLPVRNGQPYLQEAVRSILGQSLRNIELICIDDGSSDSSARLLDAIRDPRGVLIRHSSPRGLSATLNEGLRVARGRYVARMDADDISHPRRLERQARFLDANPMVDVVGTWARTLGVKPVQNWRYPTSHPQIQADMLFNSALVHSSVMMRKRTILNKKAWYDLKVERAQDYELWTRPGLNLKFANLPQALLSYRLHTGQVGQNFGAGQQKTAAQVRRRQLVRLGIRATRLELDLHSAIGNWQFGAGAAYLTKVERWLAKIWEANQAASIFTPAALAEALEKRWQAACRAALPRRRAAWDMYAGSPLARRGSAALAGRAAFWVKAHLLWQ